MATIRYTFGEEKQYFYEFVIHSKQVNVDITHNTISLSSANVAYVSTDIIDPFFAGFSEFFGHRFFGLLDLCRLVSQLFHSV